MTTIEVTATRWEGGWELAIDGEPVTQVSTLDHAAQQVLDYLDTAEPAVDHSGVHVQLRPELGDDLGERIEAARKATREAQERQVEAAQQARILVRELRSRQVSVTDTATILGVSRGRVSQLAAQKASKTITTNATSKKVAGGSVSKKIAAERGSKSK